MKRIMVKYLILAFVFGVASCTKAPLETADVVFSNAKVYTVNDAMPWADAVAVKADRIVYVGSQAGVQGFVNGDTITHDLGGKMLLPGFIDAHMHPISGGAYALALSLDTFGNPEQWITDIANFAAKNPSAPVIFGYGFLASAFGPEGPTRKMIDSVVADRPVLIMDEGFHGAWANSKALELLGITNETPDPVPGFSYYKRDRQGEATGYLLEGTAGNAMKDLDVITEEVVVEGVSVIMKIMNSFGITSAFDAGAIQYQQMLPRVLERMGESMTIRIIGSYRPGGPDDVGQAVEAADVWRDTIKGDKYHYRILKIMDDGTVEGRTAAMFEDYQGEPGNKGETVYTQEQMNQMVVGAAQEQIDVHIHALGERAIHEALNAIEVAREAHPDSSTRYAICHIQVITDEDLPRFAALDVIAQSTPLWAAYDTYGKQFVSDDQFERYWRFKSLGNLGVKLTFGSDFPASGAGTLGMSPLFNIEIGHTRQDPGNKDAPVQPRLSERLDIETLIHGYTINAAYQLHMEDEIGSIEVGKKADLTVLDRDIFDVDPYEIHKTEVVMTVMDGNVVYINKSEN